MSEGEPPLGCAHCACQVEESTDNHFMYWVNRGYKGKLGAFTPPTKNLHSIKFHEWLKIAHTADEVWWRPVRLPSCVCVCPFTCAACSFC